MSQNTDAKEKTSSSLKDLLNRLNDIYGIMDDTDSKLNYLARNTPAESPVPTEQSAKDLSATLEGLYGIVDRIGRKANSTAKSTSMIVGS